MKNFREFVKEHKIMTASIAAILCVGVVFVILLLVNKNYIEFSVKNHSVIEIEYGSGSEMEPVSALYKGTIFHRKGTPLEVSVEGQVEYDKIGIYEISYFAKEGNTHSVVEVTVVIKDTQAPAIILASNPEHYTSPVGNYQEEGYIALDNYDGDITANVTSEEKDGKVIYTVQDSSGNITTVERTIIYKDVIAPVISLKGKQNTYMYVGGSFSDAGYSAVDECDGDITGKVQVEGSVNPNQVGNYTLVYKVCDSSGNWSEVKRTVNVRNVPTGEKVIYLTFDDGPCAYTKTLLDVLDQYNVKATFFVTGGNSSYRYLIGEAYRRGHTIGIHTFSHKYNEIYCSVDAYFADFNKIKAIVKEQTQEEPWLIRFPGGTSNTVSRKYCSGIMTRLTQEVQNAGYVYCDWNVSSGDAGGATTEQAVINNVINGCASKNNAIVLQHDLNKYSVNAVDNIIEWGIANGYTFKAIDRNTPMVQYRPQN